MVHKKPNLQAKVEAQIIEGAPSIIYGRSIDFSYIPSGTVVYKIMAEVVTTTTLSLFHLTDLVVCKICHFPCSAAQLIPNVAVNYNLNLPILGLYIANSVMVEKANIYSCPMWFEANFKIIAHPR